MLYMSVMRFKIWFYENLAGPGGGPEPQAERPDKLAMNMHAHGVGAFEDFSDDSLPPKQGKSPVRAYLPPHTGKSVAKMRKKMKR